MTSGRVLSELDKGDGTVSKRTAHVKVEEELPTGRPCVS